VSKTTFLHFNPEVFLIKSSGKLEIASVFQIYQLLIELLAEDFHSNYSLGNLKHFS